MDYFDAFLCDPVLYSLYFLPFPCIPGRVDRRSISFTISRKRDLCDGEFFEKREDLQERTESIAAATGGTTEKRENGQMEITPLCRKV